MAALTLALRNARLVFLGADVPTPEIVRAPHQHGAEAVILSAAEGVDRAHVESEIAALRSALPPDVSIDAVLVPD